MSEEPATGAAQPDPQPQLAPALESAPAPSGLMGWLHRHAAGMQVVTGLVTMLIALAALVGVKLQIDASARQQREQSARDIYREYLNLSIARPELARPDYCAILGTPQESAYENYVDYMLYTAEQAIAADADWTPVFERNLAAHAAYICSVNDWSDFGPDAQAMIGHFRARSCAAVRPCAVDGP